MQRFIKIQREHYTMKAIIFDLDGTLIDSPDHYYKIFVKLAKDVAGMVGEH